MQKNKNQILLIGPITNVHGQGRVTYETFEIFKNHSKVDYVNTHIYNLNIVIKLLKSFDETLVNYLKNMNSFQIDKALKNIFDYLSEVNAYVDSQAPWSLKKTDDQRMKDVLYLVTLITIPLTIFEKTSSPIPLGKFASIIMPPRFFK